MPQYIQEHRERHAYLTVHSDMRSNTKYFTEGVTWTRRNKILAKKAGMDIGYIMIALCSLVSDASFYAKHIRKITRREFSILTFLLNCIEGNKECR